MNIEQNLAEDGIRLTLVGISTAFALLVFLTMVVSFLGVVVSFISKVRLGRGSTSEEGRNKAIAAVVAVTAVRAKMSGPSR